MLHQARGIHRSSHVRSSHGSTVQRSRGGTCASVVHGKHRIHGWRCRAPAFRGPIAPILRTEILHGGRLGWPWDAIRAGSSQRQHFATRFRRRECIRCPSEIPIFDAPFLCGVFVRAPSFLRHVLGGSGCIGRFSKLLGRRILPIVQLARFHWSWLTDGVEGPYDSGRSTRKGTCPTEGGEGCPLHASVPALRSVRFFPVPWVLQGCGGRRGPRRTVSFDPPPKGIPSFPLPHLGPRPAEALSSASTVPRVPRPSLPARSSSLPSVSVPSRNPSLVPIGPPWSPSTDE